ncbi:hypothetical protein JCM8097_001368 [Rhodosporidiobolus ruineniae]
MSSSPPGPPPLPDELVLHILHVAYPPHVEDDYIGRARDVLQCCLVSKQWKELAEPALFRTIRISTDRAIDRLALAPLDKRQWTRTLRCVDNVSDVSAPRAKVSRFRAALELLPEVERVDIDAQWDDREGIPLRLSDLEVLPNLKSLTISTPTYVDLRMALPRLEFLSLANVFLDQDFGAVLTSARLPSLRHVVLLSGQPWFGEYIDLSALLGHVTCLEIAAALIDDETDTLFRSSSSTEILLRIEEHDLSYSRQRAAFSPSFPHPPKHFRLETEATNWRLLLATLFDLPHRPETLFLPDRASDPAGVGGSEADELAREAFLRRCREEGVEVIFYRQLGEQDRGGGCAEFREFVERRKKGEGRSV